MDIDMYKNLFGTRKFTSIAKLTPGTVVQFTYDGEQKYAVVLDPEWQKKMHALSLRNLSVEQLQNLLGEIKDITSRDELYAKYKSSQYTELRSYRTYSIEKVKTLREIYLKDVSIASDMLKLYEYIRVFTAEEIMDAVGEYFENEYTYQRFPKLASGKNELVEMINKSKQIVLTKSQLIALENSNVEEILTSKNPKKAVRDMMLEQERGVDLDRILDGINKKVNLPMPIVISHVNGYYLMGGNSRLSALAAIGYTMPVKLLVYKG
jgi:hypothetical protein